MQIFMVGSSSFFVLRIPVSTQVLLLHGLFDSTFGFDVPVVSAEIAGYGSSKVLFGVVSIVSSVAISSIVFLIVPVRISII